MITRRILVTGRVQGVGYRAGCARQARALGVDGTVRNLDDGRVEVVAAGDPTAVGALVEWCRHGPPGAEVGTVTVEEPPGDVEAGSGFRAR